MNASANSLMVTLRRWRGLAGLALRLAVRSRQVASLVVLLVVACVALPLSMEGDGTPDGLVRAILRYALTLAGWILGAATLVMGSLSISREREDRPLQLLAVKPVRAWELWLGKWLALMALNGALLLLAAVLMGASMGFRIWRLPAAERAQGLAALTCRQALGPLPVEAGDPALIRKIDELRRAGVITRTVADGVMVEEARFHLGEELRVVGPGATRQWTFALPGRMPPASGALVLRINFSIPGRTQQTVSGTWTLRLSSASNRVELPMIRSAAGVVSLPLTVPDVWKGETLVIGFVNGDETHSATFILDQARGVELRVRESGFVRNLLKGLLLQWARLAVLAALSVTLSACFSPPVAVFASIGLVITFSLAGFFTTEHGGHDHDDCALHDHADPSPHWTVRAGRVLGRPVAWAVAPIRKLEVVEAVETGERIGVRETVSGFFLLAAGYPLVLGWIGGRVLRRREPATGAD